MNTRRYPRTMADAFGPHTNNVLHPMGTPRFERSTDYPPLWKGVMVVIALLSVYAVVVTA